MLKGRETELSLINLIDKPDILKSILEQTGDGIYITDKERKMIFWNNAAQEITGYNAEEVLGKRCADGILEHIDMAGNKICDTNLCPLHNSIVTGAPSTKPLTVRAKHKSGHRVVVEVTVAPVRDSSGEIIGGVEIFRDVSKKIALTEERSRFFTTLNHDLKTPLTNIKGYLDLLLEGDAGKLNEVQTEFIETIYSQEEKLEKLIEELLEMSRFESKEFSYEQNILDLSELLKKVIHSFRGDAGQKGIAIETEIPEKMFILGDRDRLWQAFSNLIANAIKYTDRGKVAVNLSHNPGNNAIELDIKDTGIGIPAGELDNIFKLFYRVENEETLKNKGTGVGLYIANNIIRHHKGIIEVESMPNKGSSFRVILPGPVDKNEKTDSGAGDL